MDTEQFGGNSNRRGPVWLPINFLLIEARWAGPTGQFHVLFDSNWIEPLPTDAWAIETAETGRMPGDPRGEHNDHSLARFLMPRSWRLWIGGPRDAKRASAGS